MSRAACRTTLRSASCVGAVDDLLGVVVERALDPRVELRRRARARAAAGRARRGRRRCPRRGGPGGYRSTSSVRSARMLSRGTRWRRAAACAAPRVSSGMPVGRRRRSSNAMPGEVLQRPVVQLGGDPAALLGAGLVGAAGQHLAALLLAADPAGEQVPERQLAIASAASVTRKTRHERAPDPVRRRVDPARGLVGLDQHARRRRRARAAGRPPSAGPGSRSNAVLRAASGSTRSALTVVVVQRLAPGPR